MLSQAEILNTVSSFTYTYNSITITKTESDATDWSWTLNGTGQGTVTGASGLTQTITGLTLTNGDVVVVTMSGSSVTETLSISATVTNITFNSSQKFTIIKSGSTAATNWTWAINGSNQGTVTGSSGSTQVKTFSNRVLKNGDTVAVTMSGVTYSETISGLAVSSFSINYCIGGKTLTHNDPNDVHIYLYDNNGGTLSPVVFSWGDTQNTNWLTYTNNSINFRTSNMRVIMKFTDGPHVHDTGIYSVTLNGITKNFISDFAGFTINDFNSSNFNISTAVAPSGKWRRRVAASYNGSALLVSAHPTGNAFFFYEGSSVNAVGQIAWIISPTY
jgi:hypothetical protein